MLNEVGRHRRSWLYEGRDGGGYSLPILEGFVSAAGA